MTAQIITPILNVGVVSSLLVSEVHVRAVDVSGYRSFEACATVERRVAP